MRVTSLGFQTDLALRIMEGAEVTDRGGYLVIRSPGNPDYWWGNYLLLAEVPEPGTGGAWLARFAAEFPAARHVAVVETKTVTLPKAEEQCPKCGNGEAYWVLRQTRGADEPETRIFECTKCGHKWREYQ